jgi:hypothetical protein
VKAFLKIHFVMWFFFTVFVVFMGSVWTGMTESYLTMTLPFIILFSHIEVLPFSAGAFLIYFFIKHTWKIEIKKRDDETK